MTSSWSLVDVADWTLVVVFGVTGGVAVLNVLSLMRPPLRSTRRRPRLLRALTTRLPEGEVRRRLQALADAEGLRILVAEDPPRLVLVTRGRPLGRNGPGFRYPVYLTPVPDGTLVEVGAVRSVPALASAVVGPLDNAFEAVRARLDGETSRAHPLTSAPRDLFVESHRERGRTRLRLRTRIAVVGVGFALGFLGLAPGLLDLLAADDDVDPNELHWLRSVGIVDGHSLVIAAPGGRASVAITDGPLDTWYDAGGREHHDSWPRCLRDGTWRLRFATYASDDDLTVPAVAAVDCRGLQRVKLDEGPPRRRR